MANERLARPNLGQLVYDVLEVYFEQHKGTLPAPGLYKRVLVEVEKPLLFLTLRAAGNQQRAAKVLGLNRNTLRKKMKEILNERKDTEALHQLSSLLRDVEERG